MRNTTKAAAVVADAYILALRCQRNAISADDIAVAITAVGTEGQLVTEYTQQKPVPDTNFNISEVSDYLNDTKQTLQILQPYLNEKTVQLLQEEQVRNTTP